MIFINNSGVRLFGIFFVVRLFMLFVIFLGNLLFKLFRFDVSVEDNSVLNIFILIVVLIDWNNGMVVKVIFLCFFFIDFWIIKLFLLNIMFKLRLVIKKKIMICRVVVLIFNLENK